MSYPNNQIETYCETTQEWRITSPQYPGTMHCIESRFVNDPTKGEMLPSPVVREYAADVARKVANLIDWGGSRAIPFIALLSSASLA